MDERDERIVNWIGTFAQYLEREKQTMLTFLARRIAFEPWLVPEFGFCIENDIKNSFPDFEVFFELGGQKSHFDLIMCPPNRLGVLLKYLKENGLVIEFKTGTYDSEDRRGIPTSKALVGNGGIIGDLEKLQNYQIEHGYLIGFLYGLSASESNPFLRGDWRPLDHDNLNDQFDRMRTSVENGIQSDAIEPLHHNQNLSLTFGDNNISGKATFLVYKVIKGQER